MGAVRRGGIGCTGVPNAGDDERIGFSVTTDGSSGRLVVAMNPTGCRFGRSSLCCMRYESVLKSHRPSQLDACRGFARARATLRRSFYERCSHLH